MISTRSSGTFGVLLQPVMVTTLGVLPAYLVGALAVQIRADLNIGPAQIGMAAAALFAVSGVFAQPLGRLVQRIGVLRGVAASASLAAVSFGGAGLAPSFGVLVAALIIGGLANGLAQPAANLGISRAVNPGRLGLAFGIKQCSIPAAGLIGGLAVPGIALTLGWRYAFALGVILAVGLALWAGLRTKVAPALATEPMPAADRGTPRAGLIMLAVGAGLAAAAATSMGLFLVDSAVESGMSPSAAGYLFAGAALLGLLIRIALGAAMDRFPQRSPYVLVANLLTVGVVGYVLLSVGSSGAFLAGALLAYSAGWTWPGLIHFAVVRDNRQGAASATGVLQTGFSLGAAGGPLLFGFLVAATSYRTAWLAAAAVAVAAVATFRLGRRSIRLSRAAEAGLEAESPVPRQTPNLPPVISPAEHCRNANERTSVMTAQPPPLSPGLWGVLATPFGGPALTVDTDSLRREVQLYTALPATGLVVLGVFGEGASLTAAEQSLTVRTVADESGETPLVVGLSARTTAVAIEQAFTAVEAAGSNLAALMVQANSATPGVLVPHLQSIYRATGTGIVLQDYPLASGVKISTEQILTVIAECDFVVAVKSEAPPTASAIAHLTRSTKIPIYGGLGGVGLLDELAAGAAGAMTGFSHPEGLQAALTAFAKGGFASARSAFAPWLPLVNFEAQPGVGLALRKEILRRRGIIADASVRPPAPPLPRELADLINAHLDTVGMEIA